MALASRPARRDASAETYASQPVGGPGSVIAAALLRQDDDHDKASGSGTTFERRFEAAGTFVYVCLYHPWLTGTVVVTAP